ncbi:MAG: type III pantothenate kinase [Proteobacteria bacterium]|jgi:type III pantothenate kinase|nr:type III pantothenate kinase [Alphaproteobacteria bacterium]NCC02909.1 type III pantothenate kinase [Pseudomonadota bacterium]
MLLAIDAGNTNTVFALFDQDKQVGLWRTATNVQRTSDEYAVFLTSLMTQAGLNPALVDGAIIGSVVPDMNFNLTKLCRDHFHREPILVGAKNVETGVEIAIDRPEELGADRLINAVAGVALYEGPLLIIDFGTATTIDVIDGSGVYRGGAIAPGVNLSIRALHMAAAKLPSVAVARPPKVIATNTVTAIQSGVFWGYVGMIEGLIARTKEEFGFPMKVVATGGLSKLFIEALPCIDEINMDLTLRGLFLIYEKNKRKS